MEIERKFTLKSLPDNLESYPSHHIEQVYLNIILWSEPENRMMNIISLTKAAA